MARFQLSRRRVLRGMGGVAVALPALEAMAPRRAQAATPQRFVTLYGGSSLGTTNPKNQVVPLTPGPDWELTHGLQPVGTLGVKKDVALISGLKIPWVQADGAIPPGGRGIPFHGYTIVPQLAGMRVQKLCCGDYSTVPSADQIAADRLSVGAPQRCLPFRVQPVSYQVDDSSKPGSISWGKGGVRIEPIVSPRLAYQTLFSGFQPPTTSGTTPNPALALALARRRSVLDLVGGETDRLMLRLGKSDRDRLQSHFDELRALEMRLTSGYAIPNGAGCSRPMDPGTDPEIRGTYATVKNSVTKTAPSYVPFISGVGYSNEELRAQILCDLVAMAFACDLSRVASVGFTYNQCVMRMDAISGQQRDMHNLAHNAEALDVADGVAWHVKHFSRLVAKLRDTPDVGGKSILDSAALVLLFEGGHGFNPEGGGQFDSHSTQNMIALVAGRAGGLKMGQHIVATDKHPAQVVLTAMNAVGVPAPSLGEVSGSIAGLS